MWLCRAATWHLVAWCSIRQRPHVLPLAIGKTFPTFFPDMNFILLVGTVIITPLGIIAIQPGLEIEIEAISRCAL